VVSRGLRFVVALTLSSALIAPASPATGRPATAEELCGPFFVPYVDNNFKIDEHNSKPHVFPDTDAGRALAAAYNEEAIQLQDDRARLYDNWQQCMDILDELRNGKTSSLDLQTIAITVKSLRTEADLAEASAKVPKNFPPPAPPPPGQGWQVPSTSPLKPLYDLLRPSTPGKIGAPVLNGLPKPAVGDPDPAFPGNTIKARGNGNPDVSADHIVPLAELVSMPDFWRLSPKFQYMLSRAPFNYQWLSGDANQSKGSRSAASMKEADPAWIQEQVQLEDSTRARLQELLSALAALPQ
jgi:hypothetical protein